MKIKGFSVLGYQRQEPVHIETRPFIGKSIIRYITYDYILNLEKSILDKVNSEENSVTHVILKTIKRD